MAKNEKVIFGSIILLMLWPTSLTADYGFADTLSYDFSHRQQHRNLAFIKSLSINDLDHLPHDIPEDCRYPDFPFTHDESAAVRFAKEVLGDQPDIILADQYNANAELLVDIKLCQPEKRGPISGSIRFVVFRNLTVFANGKKGKKRPFPIYLISSNFWSTPKDIEVKLQMVYKSLFEKFLEDRKRGIKETEGESQK